MISIKPDADHPFWGGEVKAKTIIGLIAAVVTAMSLGSLLESEYSWQSAVVRILFYGLGYFVCWITGQPDA